MLKCSRCSKNLKREAFCNNKCRFEFHNTKRVKIDTKRVNNNDAATEEEIVYEENE